MEPLIGNAKNIKSQGHNEEALRVTSHRHFDELSILLKTKCP